MGDLGTQKTKGIVSGNQLEMGCPYNNIGSVPTTSKSVPTTILFRGAWVGVNETENRGKFRGLATRKKSVPTTIFKVSLQHQKVSLQRRRKTKKRGQNEILDALKKCPFFMVSVHLGRGGVH